MSHREKSTLMRGLGLLLVLGLMASVLWRDAHSPWAFEKKSGSVSDNFFIALNAKNISEGKGWGLYNGDRFVPFERELSTGPVVFLPVAFAMSWIDDRDDARYLGTILLHMLLLGLFLWRVGALLESQARSWLWVLLPLLMLAFMREQWYLVLGEVSASLLLLLSVSYAISGNPTSRDFLLSGLCAGMALMCKLISILCSPWILFFLLITQWRSQGIRAAVLQGVRWVLAFCLVPGLVALWHWYGLGQSWSAFIAYTKDYLSYYFGLGWTGKMESTVCVDPKCLMANHRTAVKSWIHGEGFALATLIAATPVLVLVLAFRAHTVLQRYVLLAGILCCAQLLFFYANGIHWQSRYYFIAGFLGTVAWALWLAHCFSSAGPWRVLLAGFLLAAVAAGSWPWFRPVGMTPAHRDAREVAAWINETSEVREVMWPDIAPTPFLLVDLYLAEGKTWTNPYGFGLRYLGWLGSVPTPDGTYYWKERRTYYVLQQKPGNEKPVKPELCATQLFENAHYRVLNCQPKEIEAYFLALTGGKIRFIPKPTP